MFIREAYIFSTKRDKACLSQRVISSCVFANRIDKEFVSFLLSRGAISRKRKIPLERNAKKKIALLDRRDLFLFPFFGCRRGFTRAQRIRLREGSSSRGTALKNAQIFEAHEGNC